MRTCPSCHSQYTDETLRYCLQDGAPLESLPVTEQATVSFAGPELDTAARVNTPAQESEVTQWKLKSEVTHVKPSPFGSKTALTVAATAVATLLVFGVIGIAAWIYFKDSGDDTARNANNSSGNHPIPSRSTNSNGLITPAPIVVPSATVPTNKNNSADRIVAPPPQIDKQQASREVSQQIDSWNSLAESGDLDSYMRKYSGTVDYYRKRGASIDFVRSDKQRSFNTFNSMSVGISNMNVTVDDSGERATALFDKEWVFEGARRSTGKVRQQIQFRKLNGQWVITGERDVKVYFTN